MGDEQLVLIAVDTGKEYVGTLDDRTIKGALEVTNHRNGGYDPFSNHSIAWLVSCRKEGITVDVELGGCQFTTTKAPVLAVAHFNHCNDVMVEIERTTVDGLVADRFRGKMMPANVHQPDEGRARPMPGIPH